VTRRTSVVWAWLAVLLVLAGARIVWAQGRTPVIDDPDRLFGDGSAVRDAAERLRAEDVDVVVIAVRNAGRDITAAQEYLNRRLNELNIASQYSSLRGSQIVFFVAPQPGYNSIHYVSRYRPQLDPVYRTIATSTMQPLFTQDRFSEGMVAGIDAVRNTLNPPTPRSVPIAIGVVAALAVLALVIPLLLRRRAASNALQMARRRMEEARRAAGVALADLGNRVRAAQEQAQFDEVSYGGDRARRIANVQERGERLFREAQAAFDTADERTTGNPTTPAAYNSLTALFNDVVRLTQEAAGPIGEAEQLRISYDRAQSPRA
jgi:hypothetical protein